MSEAVRSGQSDLGIASALSLIDYIKNSPEYQFGI